MTLGVFVAVMFAAILHAGWNAIVKTGLNKQTSMFMLAIGHAVIGGCVALANPIPVAEAWPWLIVSGLFHTLYQLFLAYAYEQGDLSRVYPIARGTAPMVVLVISLLFLSDDLKNTEIFGILVLGGGIALMASGVLKHGESRKLVPLALGSALATAGYTLTDGLGARVSGDPIAYVGWLMVLSAVFYTPVIVALRGTAVLRANRRAWLFGLGAAGASYAAYAIAVWAMTVAPIALVGALRETSIFFAVLIGWLFVNERMDLAKAVAALCIVSGVMLTRA